MTAIERDRYQRPLILPPDGGKPVAYSRCTQYVGSLDDTFQLNLWKQRKVAEGFAVRDDLVSLAKQVGRDPGKLRPAEQRVWRDRMNSLCAQAQEAANVDELSQLGTDLHHYTEKIDLGEDPGDVPPELHRDLDAYLDATEKFTYGDIERFVVNDDHKVGGTYDRSIRFNGELALPDGTPAEGLFVGDLKTGSIAPGILKIGMQLGMYARSLHYDPTDGAREETGMRADWGLIVHLPAWTGTCELVWVNLDAAWEHVETCRRVKAARSVTFKKIAFPATSVA